MSTRPGHVCGPFFAMTTTIGMYTVTGINTALKFNDREGITSVSKKILGSDASSLRDFDKLS